MTEQISNSIQLAGNLRRELAGADLPTTYAKLYSQHTRLSANRPSLITWQKEEALLCLDDAMRLLEAAFIERDAGNDNWRDSARRTGELLEWLSHPELNPEGLPLRLLAAAAYQLAGYPARSSGLLYEDATESGESRILRLLLKAEFPNLLQQLTRYWAENLPFILQKNSTLPWQDSISLSYELQRSIVKETASSLGVLCSEMRWGDEARLKRALDKLKDIGKLLIYGEESYSWLLAKLCAEVSNVYVNNSMRQNLEEVSWGLREEGKTALGRYIRQCYQHNKALAWPSQVRGIEKLVSEESFTLCTPTGSGKTTVAEVAILQSLFSEPITEVAPLAIYLVPSRALATEVESKLDDVLTPLNDPPIIVTGLYGGNDWGPTDVWLTKEQPTILICTYEKAEALIRFLGPKFLHRVSLIILDEAHMIQFEGKDRKALRTAESRALRLESLGTRLFTYLNQNQRRVIALSAVASGMEHALARWVTGNNDAVPTKTSYRSTRQLIGRLECLPNRGFRIYYDLLDGVNLRLQLEKGSQNEIPYILNPFPSYPEAIKWESSQENQGPKRIRTYLFWAAMQLASPDDKGQQRAVLISITQNISGYAKDLLSLLNSAWDSTKLPMFFQRPTNPEKLEKWEKCLQSCEDYFGKNSQEYQLLEKGIVVHYGRMPGLMARFLIEVIQERIVHLVLATSTLSEGVNLPFETILIPSLVRNRVDLTVREFGNLVGRAGRPGYSTEGKCLVILEPEPSPARRDKEAWQAKKTREIYFGLTEALAESNKAGKEDADALSPLAELLTYLEEQWQRVSNSNNRTDFLKWLEQTAPLDVSNNLGEEEGLFAVEALDSLDSVLLSLIVEIEQLENKELTADELEERLQEIWQRSYAYYASEEEAKLNELFVRRGSALLTNIYPSTIRRRQLYRTNLPPRSGNQLLNRYTEVIDYLKLGEQYASWPEGDERRFEYVATVVDLLKSLPKVGIEEYLGKGKNRIPSKEVLRWWLTSKSTKYLPSDVSGLHKFVSNNFVYRFNWGLGSIISLAMDQTNGGKIFEPSLDNWPQTGLPWIVFWLKELITWGTLEPVAAYLLAKRIEVTRTNAERTAKDYYDAQSKDLSPNEFLNATLIRDWASLFSKQKQSLLRSRPPAQIFVNLLRDFSNATKQDWRVLPVEVDDNIYWLDPAGFPLATCRKLKNWEPDSLDKFDFTLNSFEKSVIPSYYI